MKLSEQVKQLEDSLQKAERELGEIRATMLLNFGGANTDKLPKLIDSTDSAQIMLMKILKYYVIEKKS